MVAFFIATDLHGSTQMEINLFKMDKIIKSFYEVYNGLDSEVRIQKICF